MTISAPLKDRLIPWYFVMFFVVVFAVNGVFIYLATSTQSGLVTEQAYEKGLAYNQTISKAATNQALGWHAEMSLTDTGLALRLTDGQGSPIIGAKVQARFIRPASSGHDMSHTMAELESGRYIANITLPLKGQWDVTIAATWNQQHYQETQRLMAR